MRVDLQSLWSPKAGNTAQEYEDAFSPRWQGVVERRRFRIAIADGATESSFSRLWARMLVRSHVASPLTAANLRSRVHRRSRDWTRIVTAQPLPWHAEVKVREGAFSTLMGLTLESTDHLSSGVGFWKAIAVGDSCLFQVRSADLVTSFPLQHSYQFGHHPQLLSSNPSRNVFVSEDAAELELEGEWRSGDHLLLMTDALAKWFLNQWEHGERPWLTLANVADQSKLLGSVFSSWVDEMREAKMMHNDDVTFLSVKVSSSYEVPTAG